MARVPALPSEYWIRSTAFPLAPGKPGATLSITTGGGVQRFANSQLASFVTKYVPLPVDRHALGQPLNVSQVPPPVTALDSPPLAGATKVPEPVSLIFSPLGAGPLRADAKATPPGVKIGGTVKLEFMMSQRTC